MHTKAIINCLPGIFYLFNDSGQFLLWNKNLEELTGFTAEEIAKMSPLDFFSAEEKQYIQQQIEKVFLEGASVAEAHIITKHQKKIPYYLTGVLFTADQQHCCMGMGIDISERVQFEQQWNVARKQLLESERNYKELFEHSPLAQWILDAQSLRFLNVNEAAVQQYGYTRDEFLGLSVLDILRGDEWRPPLGSQRDPRTQNAYSGKSIHTKKDGGIIQTEVTSITVTFNNRPSVLCIVNDITEKMQLQEELTSSVIKAQERESAQLGQALHDNVNQILTTVKLYTEMFITSSEKDHRLLEKSMQYLQECIDEIRNISKRLSAPSLGKISLEDSVIELIRSINLTNKVVIGYSFSGISNLPVNDDLHITIYRIVQEQLSNIIKHAEAQQVNVSLAYDEGAGLLKLFIQDNGKGFDLKQKPSGIGLLNITSRAENMKGKVEIQSAPGEGCTLTASFPLSKPVELLY